MAVELATAYVSLVPSATGIKGKIEKELDLDAAATTAGKSAGQSMAKSLITAATASAVGVAIGSFLRGAFDEASEAQKVGAQTTAVLKSTGEAAGVSAGQIGDLASALSEKAGIDDEVIQSGENVLLTFTNVRNEAGKGNDVFNRATKLALDMSVALGTDLKGANIQLGKALNDPIKGVTALQRAGVSFTEQQKEQIRTLVESGDVLGAQKVILAEVSKEFAGSAEAQATGADKAKVAVGNFKEAVGTALLPVLETGADLLTKVADAFSSLPGPLQDVITYGALAGGALAAVGKAAGLLKDAKGVVSPLVDALKGAGDETGSLKVTTLGWIGVAGLAAGAAYGLSTALRNNADAVDLNAKAFQHATDHELDRFVQKVLDVGDKIGGTGPGKLRDAFKQLLDADPAQAQRFIDALDRAGIKTGWYRDQLDKVTEGQAQSEAASRRHAQAVEDAGGAYDGTNTKIQEQIDLLDKRTQKMDAANNADLRVQTAQLDLTDALDEQYNAFLQAAAAGGQNQQANEDLARATIASKQAILEDAQAVREQVSAHFGGVAGSQAYRDELVRLAGTMAPGSELRNYIEGLIADLDNTAIPRTAKVDADVSAAEAKIADLLALLGTVADTGPFNILAGQGVFDPTARASGGPVGAGTYLVGERGNGAELLTLAPGSHGFVTNAQQTEAALSGGRGTFGDVHITYAGPITDEARSTRRIMHDLRDAAALAAV